MSVSFSPPPRKWPRHFVAASWQKLALLFPSKWPTEKKRERERENDFLSHPFTSGQKEEGGGKRSLKKKAVRDGGTTSFPSSFLPVFLLSEEDDACQQLRSFPSTLATDLEVNFFVCVCRRISPPFFLPSSSGLEEKEEEERRDQATRFFFAERGRGRKEDGNCLLCIAGRTQERSFFFSFSLAG